MRRAKRRSHVGTLIAGGVVIAAGVGVALVETLRMPKGTIWIVVAAAALVVFLIRVVTRE
jgi:hypothetical protein